MAATTTTTTKTRTPRTNGRAPQVPLHEKVTTLRTEMRDAFAERGDVIDGLFAAALAGEHIVLLGPPGTAKSLVARVFSNALGARFWDFLMTRYSEPNEVFGPIDLQAWSNQGIYGRRVDGFLPTADIAFVDEIFKANSSILNALLSAINERVYFDDGRAKPMPLRTVVAASNEMPESAELEAFFDRFMLRYVVDYVRDPAAFEQVLFGAEPSVSTQLTLAEWDAAQREVAAMPFANGLGGSVHALREALAQEGLIASDRRWRKLLKVLQAYAWLNGDSEVDSLHFEILKHALWREPKDIAKVGSIIAKTASPQLADALEIHDAIMEQVNGLPTSAEVGTSGRAVVSELKKAHERLTKLAGEAGGAVQQRIEALDEKLVEAHGKLTERIAREMGLGGI